MPCLKSRNAIICLSNSHRIRTDDGRYAYLSVSMSGWGGVEVYHDRAETRVWSKWYDDEQLGNAVNSYMAKYYPAPDTDNAIFI